eukprot:scaffold71412_cov63-Phaeocystis_antarctica.AAC.3
MVSCSVPRAYQFKGAHVGTARPWEKEKKKKRASKPVAAKQAAAEQAEVKAKKAVAVANKATEEERPRSWWCR